MKWFSLLVLLLTLTQTVYADNKHALDQIVAIAEQQPTKGREPFVFLYNSKKFSTFKEGWKLESDYNERAIKNNSDCRYNIIYGRRLNIWMLKHSKLVQNAEQIAGSLRELDKNQQLKSIISVTWNEQSGRPEDCQIYEINAYTVDGYVLTLEFK